MLSPLVVSRLRRKPQDFHWWLGQLVAEFGVARQYLLYSDWILEGCAIQLVSAGSTAKV